MAATPEFTATRAPAPWKQKLVVFWRWWLGELVRLAPERLTMLRGSDRAPMLAVHDGGVALVDSRLGAGEQHLALASLDEMQRKAAVRVLLERAGERRGRGRAVLGPGEALLRRANMPAATEENLRQVLGFEMDRLTPFRSDEVYFDYRIVARDTVSGQLVLQVAVARRDVVDARVRELRDLGVSVQGVAIREDAAYAGTPLDLLPSEQRGQRETSRERIAQRTAVGVVLALLFVALVYPVYRKRETFIALNPLMIKARADAEATDAIARELERQVADYNFLLARKHGTHPVLAFVEDLSRLLPDNTWVQQLDVRTVGKAREVQISGETASASKLIEILEGSSLLQNAAFRGTVTRGSQPGTERFMIAAEVRPRTLPEARPVLEMVAALPAPAAAAPAVPTAPTTTAAPTPTAPPAATVEPAARPPKFTWPKK